MILDFCFSPIVGVPDLNFYFMVAIWSRAYVLHLAHKYTANNACYFYPQFMSSGISYILIFRCFVSYLLLSTAPNLYLLTVSPFKVSFTISKFSTNCPSKPVLYFTSINSLFTWESLDFSFAYPLQTQSDLPRIDSSTF